MNMNNNTPIVPIVPKPEEADIPVYNLTQPDGTAPAPTLQTPATQSAPATATSQPPQLQIDPFDARTDGLVAGFTFTRFLAAISLITAADNLHAQSPGLYYISAGALLFSSKILEFLAHCIDIVSFVIGIVGALIIVIGGVMAVDYNDIKLDSIGILWILAGLCLFSGHSYSLLLTYGKVNHIISTSKLFAAIGAMLFTVGGVAMYSLDDINAGNVYMYANTFTSGGVCYLVHAITMASGHEAILNRVRNHHEYVQYNNNNSNNNQEQQNMV